MISRESAGKVGSKTQKDQSRRYELSTIANKQPHILCLRVLCSATERNHLIVDGVFSSAWVVAKSFEGES